MSTQAPTAPAKLTRTRGRRRPAARTGSTIPPQIAEMLRSVSDPKEQLALITAHHSPHVVKDLSYLVGFAQAEEFVQDVILQLLETDTPTPGAPYTSVEGYNRLRARLITYSTNRVIDHSRKTSARSEVLVGTMSDPATTEWLEREGGRLAIDVDDETLVSNLDASALYDAMRRVEPRDAELVRMKLEGATFNDICEHLRVRSTNAAFKQYSRAVCAVQKVLRQYGFGGFCSDYGEYLLLLRQEVTADSQGTERPLTEMVGKERALEIRLHVYGDPKISSDEGCHGCRHAGETHAVALHSFNPLVFLPAAGLIGVAKGAIAGAWGNLTGWVAGLFGGGAAVKGTAVVVAATAAIGGTITIEHVAHNARPAAPASSPAQTRVVTVPRPKFTPPARTTITKPKEATAASTSKPAGAKPKRLAPSAEQEFAPTPNITPAPRPRTSRSSGGGSASGEFTP